MKTNYVLSVNFDDGNFSDESNEPVILQEAKDFLKVDVDDDDTLIEQLITAARQQCEHFLCISLIERMVIAELQIELESLELPYGPVNEVSTVTDTDGNEITDYKLYGQQFKRLSAYSSTLATPQNNFYEPCNSSVTVTYSAGYSNLPKHFKTAILQQIAYLYQNRGDDAKLDVLSPIVMQSLQPYRRVV